MKKLLILLLVITAPYIGYAQFDSYEDEKDVTSVVVTKNMFKLLAEIDLESNDPEVKDYLELVNNLDNIKIFITNNPAVAKRMSADVQKYIGSAKVWLPLRW